MAKLTRTQMPVAPPTDGEAAKRARPAEPAARPAPVKQVTIPLPTRKTAPGRAPTRDDAMFEFEGEDTAAARAMKALATVRGERSTSSPAQGQPRLRNESDLFGRTEITQAVPMMPSPPGPILTSGNKIGARYVLDEAKEPGVYFQEDAEKEGHSEEDEDPELREAVEETIGLLFGVRGIHHVGPGRNEANEPVVVIVVGPGFGELSFGRIPQVVRGFKTLLALPFEQLPLRRERTT